jgi:hypothetical protein
MIIAGGTTTSGLAALVARKLTSRGPDTDKASAPPKELLQQQNSQDMQQRKTESGE